MIETLKPYLEYKASGLSWPGRIPAHWTPQPGFAAYREKQQKNTGLMERRVLSLSYGRIIIKSDDKLHGLVPESFETYQIVNPGDIIIRSTDLQNDKTSLRVGLVRDRGIITSAYMCFRTTDTLIPEYGYLLLHTLDLTKILYGLGSGLRQNLDFADFKRMPIFVPPLDEQAAIVRFFDHCQRRIERYILAKKKLIALLNEQRQAIIHRAITRGLDPSITLKVSGIPWLGDVPTHWRMIPARYLFRAITRRDIGADEVKLSVTQKHGLIPTDEMQENSTQASNFERFQVCHPGDLVLNKYKAHLGVFWAAMRRGLITPNYTVFKPVQKLSTKFFEYLFHTSAYRDAFSMAVYGVTEGMSPLYTQDFYRIPCVFPPADEQVRIISALGEMTKSEDAAIARSEREIGLIREYRARLIADVVTGKLDVRKAASQLPEEELETSVPSEEVVEEEELEQVTTKEA